MPGDDPYLETRIAAWEAGALDYDATPRHGLRHDDERVAWRRLVAAILGDPSHADVPRLRVLDVGTGTGVLALLAAELGHEVTAVDLSAAMLAEARRKARDAGLALELVTADAEALPVGLVGFDVVMSRHLLWTLPRPERALGSWCLAARPGGLVAIVDGVFPHRAWPGRLISEAARRWIERRSDHADHDYPAEVYGTLPLARRPDTGAIEALLRGAGLEHVRIRWLTEVDRVERAHLGTLEALADGWRRYLATGRTPVLTADQDAAGSPATPGSPA